MKTEPAAGQFVIVEGPDGTIWEKQEVSADEPSEMLIPLPDDAEQRTVATRSDLNSESIAVSESPYFDSRGNWVGL